MSSDTPDVFQKRVLSRINVSKGARTNTRIDTGPSAAPFS
jgi:hypothetical protein